MRRAYSTAQARALLGGAEQKQSNSRQQMETQLRQLFLRTESVLAFLEQHGSSGRIVLPLPPGLANGWIRNCHWTYRDQLREAYYNHCSAVLWRKLIPPPPKVPPAHARMATTLFVVRKTDATNAVTRRKWPEDWLVKNGYLKDDDEKHLQDIELLRQVVVPAAQQRVEFEITPS